MRTLIYKRTHHGDPDPNAGVFGNHNCMGSVRRREFDAVIGVGGRGPEAKHNNLAEKLNWIGIGPTKSWDVAEPPTMTFDHFVYFGENGPLLADVAPALASRLYTSTVRVLMDKLSPVERSEVDKILDIARAEPPSGKGIPRVWGASFSVDKQCSATPSPSRSAG